VDACSKDGEMITAYIVPVEYVDAKRPVGRTICRWEEYIKMDTRERGLGVGTGFVCPRFG
jgi:hypothetical protein